MRTAIAAIVAASLLSGLPAKAEVMDLSTVTCEQFLKYSQDDMGYVLIWLEGYYAEENAPPIVDFDKMKDNAGKLGGYCAQHLSVGLITAADELFAK